MSKTNRTDAHRPSTIIPANYEQWNTYSLASMEGGFPMPAIGIDCAAPYDVRDEDGKVIRRVTPVCPDTGRCCVESTLTTAQITALTIASGHVANLVYAGTNPGSGYRAPVNAGTLAKLAKPGLVTACGGNVYAITKAGAEALADARKVGAL